MTVGREAIVSLPLLTMGRHHTKCTMSRGGRDAYQMLPDPVLAVRNPLVFLDWSTNCYHPSDLALFAGMATFTKHHRLAVRIDVIRC